MKIIILILLFLFNSNIASSNSNIVYLDIQFIVDKSDLGLFYKKKIKKLQDQINQDVKKKEKIIKDKETDIKNKKNILSNDELNKSLNDLEKTIKEYRTYRNQKNELVINEKKKYTSNILVTLNPIITDFVEKNNISLVLDKKNILIGAKVLDITKNVIMLFNEEAKKQKLLNEN